MPKKGKMKGKEKDDFVARMARGKAKKAAKKKGTKTKRKKNASVKSVTKKATPYLYNVAGIGAGTFVGFKLADLADRYLISYLPGSLAKGIGHILMSGAVLYAGHKFKSKAKGLPVTATATAVGVPFWLLAFNRFGVLPLGTQVTQTEALPAEVTTEQGWRYQKRLDPRIVGGGRPRGMSGRLLEGRAPGTARMAGTLQSGRAPGTARMAGTDWYKGNMPRNIRGRGHYTRLI